MSECYPTSFIAVSCSCMEMSSIWFSASTRRRASELVMSAQMKKATGRNICIKLLSAPCGEESGEASMLCEMWIIFHFKFLMFSHVSSVEWVEKFPFSMSRRDEKMIIFDGTLGSTVLFIFMLIREFSQTDVSAFFSSTALIFLKHIRTEKKIQLWAHRPTSESDWCRNGQKVRLMVFNDPVATSRYTFLPFLSINLLGLSKGEREIRCLELS